MTTVLSLLLLVLLALLGWLLYREYRVGKSRRLPLYTEALIDLLEGRMKEAFEKLKETVNQDSDNVDAYLRLAALLRERGQAERASRIYQMLAVRRNLVPADEQRVLLALAREHLSQKRVNRAVSVLEQVSERNPKDLTSRELLLHIYLEQERWEDVEPVLKALVGLQKDRTRAALYYTAAATRLAGQNPVQAGRYFEQALGLDALSIPALIHSGDLLRVEGRIAEAVTRWKQVLARRPELGFMVRDRLEKAYYEAGRFAEMPRVYEELISEAPGEAGNYVALARIYAKMGDVGQARAVLGRLPSQRSSDLTVRLLEADLHLREGRIAEARQELARIEDQLAFGEFRCAVCGMDGEGEFRECCPNCGNWASFELKPGPNR